MILSRALIMRPILHVKTCNHMYKGDAMRTLSMAKARDQLSRLPEQFTQHHDAQAVTVTRRGKPVLAVLPWELYESILETLEILGDEEQMAALREGIRAVKQGDVVPWDDVKAALGLQAPTAPLARS